MKPGDKVIPKGHPRDSRPGTIKLISGEKAIVTWIMGSGWPWTAKHAVHELEVLRHENHAV